MPDSVADCMAPGEDRKDAGRPQCLATQLYEDEAA